MNIGEKAPADLRCSFCKKFVGEVQKIVVDGSDGLKAGIPAICCECISLAVEIFMKECPGLLPPADARVECPECRTLHVDEGEFADKSHHTHQCNYCGHCWRPLVIPTRGVRFLFTPAVADGVDRSKIEGLEPKSWLRSDMGVTATDAGVSRWTDQAKIKHGDVEVADEELTPDAVRRNIGGVMVPESVLDMSVDELDLSARACNMLDSAGIGTIGQLVKLTGVEMQTYNHCTPKVLREISAELSKLGLRLGMSSPVRHLLGAGLKAVCGAELDSSTPLDKFVEPTCPKCITLAKSVGELMISVRTENALYKADIKKIWQVAQMTEDDFKKIVRAMRLVREMRVALAEHGLAFRTF